MIAHLNLEDFMVCLIGILLFWVIRFSADKDEFDEKADKSFSTKTWLHDFLYYKWDNILIHVMVSVIFLYLGEKNLAAFIGQYLDELPVGADQIGSSFILGFFGSYIAEALKKIVKIIKK